MIRLAPASFVALLAGLTATPAWAAPHSGDLAPPFVLPSASGGTLSLAKYKGKALYVNFFASWCPPCNEEAPEVYRLYKKYRAKGLSALGVDELEDKSKALDFARKYKWPFAIAVDEGDMGKSYGAVALPVHIFIDKGGKISTYRLGQMEPAEIEEAIEKIVR